MKKWLLILLAFVGTITTQAQDNASTMKIILNADGSISPPYILPLETIESKILEIADSSIQIIDITVNSWGAFMFGNQEASDHVTKFRFIDTSDIGIDSGLVICTGRTHSDSIYFGDEEMGIAWPVTFNSTGYNPGSTSYPDTHPSRFDVYPDLLALNDGDSIVDALDKQSYRRSK